MAPTTPPDMTVSGDLSKLHIAQPLAAMHHDIPDGIEQPTKGNAVKLTLETLPPEIKNEIFSHLLLGAKVKYSTNGVYPGHKYKFNTTSLRVSKQMKEAATTYLYSQNEFALISSKFFAFAIDRGRFLPTVATGKAARTFKSPAIEATIAHVDGTICVCCNPRKHKAKDRVTHALFMVADLEHLIRELRLTYHMWPSQPIYIISNLGVSPVEHIPVNVDTQIKIVWKVNPSHRQDLTVAERRARQIRLLNPLDFPTGSGKTISVLGVNKDIARKVANQNMPRILYLDAVGYDLYNLLKAQKTHLDTILSQDTFDIPTLVHSYTDLACAAWPLELLNYWTYASVTRPVNMHGTMTSLCLMPFEMLDEEDYRAQIKDSWQLAVLCLAMDCLFTIARLTLEKGAFAQMEECTNLIRELQGHTFRGFGVNHLLFPASLRVLLNHYVAWAISHDTTHPLSESTSLSLTMLKEAREWIPADDKDNVWRYLNEDWEFMSKVVAGTAELRSNKFGACLFPATNFQGLLNRPRVHNTPVHIKPSRVAFQGWTTKREFPKPEVAADMIKFSDRIFKLKFDERTTDVTDDALDHGHVAFAILNFPRDPDEGEDDLNLPPGFPPGFPPPGVVAGGIIQVGPVTTLGQLMGQMGMPPGGGAPHP